MAQTIGLVSSVYATGRALVPGPLAGVAGSLEHRVSELSLPVISIVQDQSERVRTHSAAETWLGASANPNTASEDGRI